MPADAIAVIAGHQPTGDAPMVLRIASDDAALEVYIHTSLPFI